MKKSSVIATLLALVVLVGAIVVVAGRNSKDEAPTPTGATNQPATNEGNEEAEELNQTSDIEAAAATISYDGTGFSPSSVTIKAGENVQVLNKSDADIDFASDPHPVHTDNSELNAGIIASGEGKTFSVSEKGNWGYHNHFNESQSGEIIVE